MTSKAKAERALGRREPCIVRIATEPKLHFSLRNSWGEKRLKGFMGELLIRHQRSESRP